MNWTPEEQEYIEKTKQALNATSSGRAEILQTAERMVTGNRQHDYGDPEDNFTTIANLWTAYCDHTFTAEDVAIMMVLLKIGRISSGNFNKDNYVDAAGYVSCAGEIAERGRK